MTFSANYVAQPGKIKFFSDRPTLLFSLESDDSKLTFFKVYPNSYQSIKQNTISTLYIYLYVY